MKILYAFSFFCLVALASPYQLLAQNPAVLKAGIILNDYQRDGKTTFLQGYFGGIDARLGVYDNSYIKVGGSIGKMHSRPKDDFDQNENFFTVNEGIVFARAFAGVEFRATNYHSKFNARLNVGLSLLTTLDSFGDSSQGFSQSSFTIPIGLGFDLGILCIDATVEPGISQWMTQIKDSKPLIGTFAIGVQF